MPGPWEKYAQPQDNSPPAFIPGQVNPAKQAAEARDEVRTSIAVRGEGRDVANTGFNQAMGLRDDFNKLPEVKSYRVAIQQLDQSLKTGDGPQSDLALTYSFAKAMDPESVVREAEQGMVTNSQPWFQSAVERAKKEFGMDGAGNYTPQAREAIRQQIINSVVSRRQLYAGKRKYYSELAQRYKFDPYEIVGDDDGSPYLDRLKEYDAKGRDEKANPFEGLPSKQQSAPEPIGDDPRFRNTAFNESGQPDPNGAFDAYGKVIEGEVIGFSDAPETLKEGETWRDSKGRLRSTMGDILEGWQGPGRGGSYQGALAGELQQEGFDPSSIAAYASRPIRGFEMGLSDEIEGLGGGIAALFGNEGVGTGYELARDKDRLRQQQMSEAQGLTGAGLELLGGIATPIKGARTASTPGQFARVGATAGGLAGFGYGEGAQNSLSNAAIGSVTGAILAPTLNALTGQVASRLPKRSVIKNAPEVAAAGQAEGVTVNRAMVDPSLQNRVTGVDASLAGGPRFQRGMGEIEGQIEGRVDALGQGGTPFPNKVAAGQSYQAAGERFIDKSGKAARVQYNRAEKLAGNTKVTPTQSLAMVDDAIARLSETPGTNSDEIAFLQTIKSDLSKDLSVGGLRRMRTSLRKKISKGDLVFGEDEARILGIMDTAADDIRTGLAQQGKGAAAKAFDIADQTYRERMEYIKGTLQKIIGKRDANFPAEQVANNLSGMARGKDTEGVRKFLSTLDPDERTDVAATFADALGRAAPDEPFSAMRFITQTNEKQFPKESLKIIFGDDGAASIERLRTLAKEVNRVNSMRNTSNTARAGDYRSWLFNVALGLAPGAAGGNTAAAIGGALATGAIKGGRDMLSARTLLSPNISKWIASAPRTTNPAAINAHIAKLGSIGGASRMDARAIQEYLAGAINQSPGRAAAQDEADSRRKPIQ